MFNNRRILLITCIISVVLCGCGTEAKTDVVEEKTTQVSPNITEEKTDTEEVKHPYEELVETLGIEKYEYPSEFEVGNNLQLLLENMAIYYKHYNSDETMDAEDESAFIKNFCQNSWFCFDYLYDSYEKSDGILNKQQVEYIQYSFSGNYVEFQSIEDDFEVDINECSSGFTYAELQSNEVMSEGDEIELRAIFALSDGSKEEAEITLMKNEYSCFDGYSVVRFDIDDYESIYKNKIDIGDLNYSLIYLDDDDIPEIAIFGDGEAHNELVTIYTINENDVFEIGNFGEYSSVQYAERKGIIYEEYDSGGKFYTNIYKVSGCDVVVEASLKEECDDDQIAYYLNGERIDEKEYTNTLNEYGMELLYIGVTDSGR